MFFVSPPHNTKHRWHTEHPALDLDFIPPSLPLHKALGHGDRKLGVEIDWKTVER